MKSDDLNDDAIREGEPPYFSDTTHGADARTSGFPVKKAFLYSLIVSVLLSAFLGILAILTDSWGWFEVRIILTSVIISGASICGLACGAYLATKRGQALPLAGITLALVGAAMLIGGMWTLVRPEVYWKLTVSISVFAVACGHLALLSMVRLAGWFRWSLVVAHVVIFGVASLIVLIMLTEYHGSGMVQLLWVGTIIDSAVTVLVPIFHWLSRVEVVPENRSTHQASPESGESEIAHLKQRIAELERKKQEGA